MNKSGLDQAGNAGFLPLTHNRTCNDAILALAKMG